MSVCLICGIRGECTEQKGAVRVRVSDEPLGGKRTGAAISVTIWKRGEICLYIVIGFLS